MVQLFIMLYTWGFDILHAGLMGMRYFGLHILWLMFCVLDLSESDILRVSPMRDLLRSEPT